MPERAYQICQRCAMDTSDPNITFDDEGNCNHCIEFLSKTAKQSYVGEESDRQLAEWVKDIKAKGKNNEYDCLIGVSGGIDSSYVAYQCKQLGLRPLAVHMDNGWNSEEAVQNIKNVCDKLDIDYQSYVLNWEEFKDLQLSFLKASIVELEIPTDIAIPGALHRIAAENKIKYIISGGNFATEGILPNSWFYDPKDSKLLYGIQKKFGKMKLKDFPTFDFKKEIYFKFVKGIRMVYLLNYLPYNKDEAMKLLKDELGWKYYGGKHYESKYTGFVQSYIQPVKFGIDYRRATYATLVCAGTATREEAIEELKKMSFNPNTIDAEKAYIAKKFEISLTEFEEIMKRPVKTYRDYPNDEKRLTKMYDLYRKYFSKKE
jgi:N-acetyl sugar amidotransferase